MKQVSLAGLTLAMAVGLPHLSHASSVGSTAPALEPTEWFNTSGTVSWKNLKGRLILVEKWATW